MNVKHIDLLVGTHLHADHIGQMDTIINQFKVTEVWMSGAIATSQVFEQALLAIEHNDVGYNEPRNGEIYSIGPLDIEVVAPTSINGNLNDSSIVFKATYGNVSFLFTGDAEKSSEQTMLSNGADLKADILKLGHHGSDTSSTSNFVDAVNPKVGIISVGTNNSYGHPSASVIDRMKNRGVDLYSTSNNGTVIVQTNGKDYNITTNKDGNVTPSSKGNSSLSSPSNKTSAETNEESVPPKAASNGNCIDINSADEIKIQEIIHIGPVRSGELIELRPYNSVDNLTRFNRIGPARIDDIKSQNLACVGG